MYRIVWSTDIHFDHCVAETMLNFCDEVNQAKPDSVILTGDISSSHLLEHHLMFLKTRINVPIYFVLGNHDFYNSSIEFVRNIVRKVSRNEPTLTWLTDNQIIPITQETCIIGHDGWADGRFGDYLHSDVRLNDYVLINDFRAAGTYGILKLLNSFGDKSAAYFKKILPKVVSKFKNVIVATHVPPFEEATWHEGRMSDDNWRPHFSCKAVGDVLKNVMQANSQCQMTVLCGHTHSGGEVQILPNLLVKTGKAQYRNPRVNAIIEVH